MCRDEGLHWLRAVGVQAVPDHEQGTADPSAEVPPRGDNLRTSDGVSHLINEKDGAPRSASPSLSGANPG
jgi:hypothetical protein